MNNAIQEAMLRKITGKESSHYEKKANFFAPLALVEQKKQEGVQAVEIITVTTAATAIQEELALNGFNDPSVYMILTAGMKVPEGAKLLGKYGQKGSAFESFPKPDIYGHDGAVYATQNDDGQTILILTGRAHPYEYSGNENGDMIVSHPLQVLKEIARRQRASTGVDPLFIFTYLTGVREGQNMKPGDMAVILDDTPGDQDTHPGHGLRALLDLYFGERFQPKDGRSSDIQFADTLIAFAGSKGINLFPGAAVGTPGATEFQSSMEAALYDEAFRKALEEGNFGELVREVSLEEEAALLFCMGITAELATMRQVFHGEESFRVLGLGLATDAVGGKESTTIDHGKVVQSAMAKGAIYSNLLFQFFDSSEFSSLTRNYREYEDHSIQTKLKEA